MTARRFAVGDRVRIAKDRGTHEGLAGTVISIKDQGGFLPYEIAFDDRCHRGGLHFAGHELDPIDDTPHTSSASPTEDPADSIATPCATSATPDTATPDVDPAPEAGAASAHDAAPAEACSSEPLDRPREVVANLHDVVPVEPLGDGLESGPERIELCALECPNLGRLVGMREGGLLTLQPGLDLGHNGREFASNTHEISPSGRAEAPESPRLVTDTVGDGSDADTSLPTVGGRAVPPVPAPADTSTEPLADWELELLPTETTGATSVHDDAPVTDLAALRDAAYRLRDVRAEIDALLDVEQTLAARVSEGLGTLVGVPVDLNWGTDRPDALADGAR